MIIADMMQPDGRVFVNSEWVPITDRWPCVSYKKSNVGLKLRTDFLRGRDVLLRELEGDATMKAVREFERGAAGRATREFYNDRTFRAVREQQEMVERLGRDGRLG